MCDSIVRDVPCMILTVALVCLSGVLDGHFVIPWTVFSVFPGEIFVSLYEKLQAGSLELFQQFTMKHFCVFT